MNELGVSTDAIIVSLVGFFATMVGLYSFVTRNSKEDAREKQRIIHIEEMVKAILDIDQKLEDVLKHPEVSGFGAKEVLRNQAIMLDLVRQIQKDIQYLNEKSKKKTIFTEGL